MTITKLPFWGHSTYLAVPCTWFAAGFSRVIPLHVCLMRTVNRPKHFIKTIFILTCLRTVDLGELLSDIFSRKLTVARNMKVLIIFSNRFHFRLFWRVFLSPTISFPSVASGIITIYRPKPEKLELDRAIHVTLRLWHLKWRANSLPELISGHFEDSPDSSKI